MKRKVLISLTISIVVLGTFFMIKETVREPTAQTLIISSSFLMFLLIFGGIAVHLSQFIQSISTAHANKLPELQASVCVKNKTIVPVLTGVSFHIVTFIFPDSLEKSLIVPEDLYSIFLECDQGVLTYKEIDDIELLIPNEKRRIDGRLFISFEPDS